MAQAKGLHSELVNVRETFESIWVAIILAFVLRAFVLEAFVIPTGSMAPRLMGQHVLLECPSCAYEFAFGLAFDESVARNGKGVSGPRATCPNCREEISYTADPLGGDRVLVLKYLYKFLQPQAYDVVVFRNPQSNRDNYIKRLIGLPGEEVRIIHGDIFKRAIEDFNRDGVKDEHDLQTPQGAQLPWVISRKSHATQNVMWQLVFDNDYQPTDRRRRVPWTELWQTPEGQASNGWHLNLVDGRVFYFDGAQSETLYFARDRRDIFQPAYGYNNARQELPDAPSNITGDLKLQTVLAAKSDQGQVGLTLSNLNHQFQADLAFDGLVTLRHRLIDAQGDPAGEWETWGQTRVEPFSVGKAVPVALSHADWKVSLWVDGRAVLESDDHRYQPDVTDLVRRVREADAGDASAIPTPVVGIVAQGGQFELWHTAVMRDVFYTCPTFQRLPVPGDYGYQFVSSMVTDGGRELPGWGTMDNPIVLRAHADRPDLDEFFMLGDNSPASLDSRLWVTAAPTLRLYDAQGRPQYRLGTVPRYNMIGRAFFVYWPAGHRLPGLRLPIVPNVGKMRLIH